MDGSVTGYLYGKRNEELECIVAYCLKQYEFDFYEPIANMAMDILDQRHRENGENNPIWEQKSRKYREQIILIKEKTATKEKIRKTQWIV